MLPSGSLVNRCLLLLSSSRMSLSASFASPGLLSLSRRISQTSSRGMGWRHVQDAQSLDLYVYEQEGQRRQWPDTRLGVLGGASAFGLPGQVGFDQNNTKEGPMDKKLVNVEAELTTGRERQAQTLYSAQDTLLNLGSDEHKAAFFASPSEPLVDPFPSLVGAQQLRVEVHQTPRLLLKQLQAMFPMSKANTTLLLVQKTESDMSVYTDKMEEEREQLTKMLFLAAKEICVRLMQEKHWADFLDPSSGTPHFAADHGVTPMYETDEKFRMLGIDIEDLGCCKVVSHSKFGRFAFVGTIFTDAPANGGVIDDIFDDLGITKDNNS